MSADIVWEDPGPSSSPRDDPRRAAFAAALRAAPGEWARWSTTYTQSASAYQMANRIKNGMGIWGPPGTFEATVRTRDAVTSLYVRYVGGAA